MKDPAVQWLEHEYDQWRLIEGAQHDGRKILMVRDGNGWLRATSFSQPMFHIKNDAAGAGKTTCYRCEDHSMHYCSECGTKLTHMAGFVCQRCWLKGGPSGADIEPWTEEET